MADSIQETPESPSATIDRLSNNVRTLGRQLRDIANILGVDVDEIASAILRERKESETRESAAEDDAQRLRELVCAEDLGDLVEMSGKRPHEIGRYLIDLWQEDIQGREREKATALTAAVQGGREARHELNDCAQCGATLHPPTDPPHCEDCIVDEEHREAWEDKRERPASAVVAKREREACAACDGKGQIPEPWSGDNSVVPCPHCFGNGMRTSRRPSAVDVMAVVREYIEAWEAITNNAATFGAEELKRKGHAWLALRSLVAASPKDATDTQDGGAKHG